MTSSNRPINVALAKERALATVDTLLTSARFWRVTQQHWDWDTLAWACRMEVARRSQAVRS